MSPVSSSQAPQVEFQIRPAGKADEAFIYDTWLTGVKRGTYEAKRIRDRTYYTRRHALIERILARGAIALIAHPTGDPDTILGCVVAETGQDRPLLHWCYVKLPWRRLGIATALILAAVPDPNSAVFTTWTSWALAVPAPRGIDRGDRRAIRDARLKAVQEAERKGEAGGDTDALLKRFPGLEYDPDARETGVALPKRAA
jgi:hypothetical protein